MSLLELFGAELMKTANEVFLVFQETSEQKQVFIKIQGPIQLQIKVDPFVRIQDISQFYHQFLDEENQLRQQQVNLEKDKDPTSQATNPLTKHARRLYVMTAADHGNILIKSHVLVKDIVKLNQDRFNLKAVTFEEYFTDEAKIG